MTLEDVQTRARKALEASPAGHLSALERQVMWAALGPVANAASSPPLSPHHLARVHLMTECLRSSIDVWNEAQSLSDEPLLNPEDTPPAALNHIRTWVDGGYTPDAFAAIVGRYDDLTFYYSDLHEEHPRAEMIAHAASHVMWVALWDLPSDYPSDYLEQEDDVFPADFTIACVVSGGPPWEPDSSGERASTRGRYWRWYIDVLYPTCWKVAFG